MLLSWSDSELTTEVAYLKFSLSHANLSNFQDANLFFNCAKYFKLKANMKVALLLSKEGNSPEISLRSLIKIPTTSRDWVGCFGHDKIKLDFAQSFEPVTPLMWGKHSTTALTSRLIR